MHNFQNYIFDLDGTIINSSEEVLNCFKKAFEEAHYEIDNSRLTSDVIGPPLREIIQSIAPELTDTDKIDEIMKNFRRIYDYDENDISVMYDGMNDLLHELKIQKCWLFIATFKPTIPTMRLVKQFELDKIFDDIYTIDKFGHKITKEDMILDIISKNDLKKAETVMVGDAVSDMTAAKNAGITGIGALWGYGSDKEPLKSAADFVSENAGEVLCKN